ncbi:AMP-binding protein [Streptomyces sp. NBC_01283]|uniref:AMP-binding protein n=1 Tax=Streptomyces sp. NBC_01283 TaxID=2903812 RepID=UPI00352DF63C|nr:AMP-binding protein [Streptomyces sp. NBC_01283]WSL21344.1 AMP-binding protein [Streptomyces sp. NBC_01283]
MATSVKVSEGRTSRCGGSGAGIAATVLDVIGDRLASYRGTEAVNRGGAEGLSCTALWERAEAIAGELADAGVRRGHVVSVLLPRTTDTVAALLGVWLAGAVYVPLDPAFPAERTEYILRDCGSTVLLTHSGLGEPFAAMGRIGRMGPMGPHVIALDAPLRHTGRRPRAASVRPAVGDLAYIVYTPGSPGRPKGVQVTHRSLLNCTLRIAEMLRLGPGDVVTNVVSPALGASLTDYLVPLLSGAGICLAPQDALADAGRLGRIIEDSGTTVLQAPPVTWQILREGEWCPSGAFTALSGGQALPADLAAWIRDRCTTGIHLYGPAETTICVSAQDLSLVDLAAVHTVPLGAPIAGVTLHVLDEDGALAPAGVPGELCVSGVALARGYLNRPAETGRVFVPHPFRRGERMYRTGDLVQRHRNGSLELLGRMDHQAALTGNPAFRNGSGPLLADRPGTINPRLGSTTLTPGTGDGTNVVAGTDQLPEPARNRADWYVRRR